jgi:GNAT superfamily N-acetyltransferase
MPPFVILATPRSRTKWLSQLLSYGDWHCGHDQIAHCRSLDDVASWFAQPFTGTVETAAAPFWRLLPEGVTIVTLRRPVADVVTSYARGGLVVPPAIIERQLRKLDQIETRWPNVLPVTFDDISTEAGCARVFEHCLGISHDHAWWAACDAVNIQIDLRQMMRHFVAHRPQLEKLGKVAKHKIVAGMTRESRGIDGVTFQHEPFREFYRDAQHLFAEHLTQTGQSPDDHARKNLPLLEALDDAGMLQTITARGGNGLMYGYLQTVIGPTLDAPDTAQAWHSIFFASPDIRGLGMKLQRAALAALRERGVDEVIMRAGHRGSGPRLGTFYRRLGAEEFGQLYRLKLELN